MDTQVSSNEQMVDNLVKEEPVTRRMSPPPGFEMVQPRSLAEVQALPIFSDYITDQCNEFWRLLSIYKGLYDQMVAVFSIVYNSYHVYKAQNSRKPSRSFRERKIINLCRFACNVIRLVSQFNKIRDELEFILHCLFAQYSTLTGVLPLAPATNPFASAEDYHKGYACFYAFADICLQLDNYNRLHEHEFEKVNQTLTEHASYLGVM